MIDWLAQDRAYTDGWRDKPRPKDARLLRCWKIGRADRMVKNEREVMRKAYRAQDRRVQSGDPLGPRPVDPRGVA